MSFCNPAGPQGLKIVAAAPAILPAYVLCRQRSKPLRNFVAVVLKWRTVLTPDSPKNSVTSSQTPKTSANTDTCSVTNPQKPADHKSAFVTHKVLNNNDCYEVTQKTGGDGVKIVEIEI